MAITETLDGIVGQFDLNKHPFYRDWSLGTLPETKLADYALQYAPFVGTIALGWDALGEWELGDEERTHESLWAKFRKELAPSTALSGAAGNLATTAVSQFGTGTPEAIGALYAFEAQQPHTSRTKLDGLVEHYAVSEDAREYFKVHADDLREVEILQERAVALSEAEQARATSACAAVCAAMWKTLDAVYYA